MSAVFFWDRSNCTTGCVPSPQHLNVFKYSECFQTVLGVWFTVVGRRTGTSSWLLDPENSDIQVDFGTHMLKYTGRLFLKTSAISVQNLQPERFNKPIQCDLKIWRAEMRMQRGFALLCSPESAEA